MAARIHPTAIVDPTAELADGVTIGAYAIVGPQVTLGEGTEIRHHGVVESHCRMGRENVVFQYATVAGTPQDRKFHGEVTWCEVGDRNHIRENVTIHRGTGNGGGWTRIGSDNLLMVGMHVAHDCVLGNHLTVANEVMIAGHVHVHDRATLGGGCGLHHFATVGTCAFVAAMASVERDVPPFMIADGNRASIRAPNIRGMQKWGYSKEALSGIRTSYRRLFGKQIDRNGLTQIEVAQQLREEFRDVPEVIAVCDAVESSIDGVNGRALERERPDDKRSVISSTSGAASVRAPAGPKT